MEDPELAEMLEVELRMLVNKAHKSGLSFKTILFVLDGFIQEVKCQVEVEKYV